MLTRASELASPDDLSLSERLTQQVADLTRPA
jgi:hypothetical protein